MGGWNWRYPLPLIFLCFVISSEFWGFPDHNSLLEQILEVLEYPEDNSVSKPREDGFHETHCSRERSRIAWEIVQEYLMPYVENERYQLPSNCRVHRDNDIYRAQNTARLKSKCNPAAAARNRLLCESLANTCFPVNNGPSANRLHEFFLRQFCDAHTCSGGSKPLSKKTKEEKYALHYYLHHYFAIASSLLHLCLFVPKGIKEWSSRTETY
ncbi:unnamed protein product [Arabis nemorensis]|uniref:Uncharacterized protein n=1 Tax=Arabis nemorensis TaxID=586526 RepID=A0A565C766_9BRAS|nr:unnamed protein product [Arabis nemorensis]